MTRDVDFTEFITRLNEEYQLISNAEKITKRAAVRVGIANLLRDKVVLEGEKLPSEVALANALDVSVGTVQAALQQLRELGLIKRRRGDGTRVSRSRMFVPTARHFRFRSLADGKPVRFTDDKITITLTTQPGPWCEHFPGVQNFVKICRNLTLNHSIPVFAAMYLDATRVEGIMEFAPSELKFVNIRLLLDEKFELVTATTTNFVKVVELSENTAKLHALNGRGNYYSIDALAHDLEKNTIYYQQLITSINGCQLEL